MTTVREVLSRLADAPPDAVVYADDGEDTGIVIVDTGGRQIGFIHASDADEDVRKVRGAGPSAR